MSIRFRTYTEVSGITEDYHRVRSFLVDIGYSEFTYARWDWMATHGWLDPSAVGRIGVWEDADRIVGLATFDTRPGNVYCIAAPGYETLKREMLEYAEDHLAGDEGFRVVIPDTDVRFQDIAAKEGYVATDRGEHDAVFYLDRTSAEYRLPERFRITDMQETYDLYEYRRILWKGFNHELKGEGPLLYSPEEAQSAEMEMRRPHVDLELKIAVVAPDGHFASYCGMWYDKKAGFAVIEPVATDPDYRRMGLGRAVVLEGIRRVGTRGAPDRPGRILPAVLLQYRIAPFASASEWRRESLK